MIRNEWKQKMLSKGRKLKIKKIKEAVERRLDNLNSNQEKMLNLTLERRKQKIELDALMRHGNIMRQEKKINLECCEHYTKTFK